MTFEFDAIRPDAQDRLLSFLHDELNAGTTFAQAAVLANQKRRPGASIQAKRNSVKAADSVRNYIRQVHDANTRSELQAKLDELDRMIAGL